MQLHRAICKVQLTLNTFMSQNSLLTVDYGPSVEFHHSVQKMSGQNVMANKFTRTCLWHHDIGNSMLISTLWNNWAIILSISLPQGSHSNVRIKISTFLDPFKHHFELKTILLIAKQDTATPMQHTHTRLTALCPGLPGWAGTRKVKPIWILLKQETVSGSGISWAICKSAPRCRQITTPAHHTLFFTGRMPFLSPNQQHQSTEGTQHPCNSSIKTSYHTARRYAPRRLRRWIYFGLAVALRT